MIYPNFAIFYQVFLFLIKFLDFSKDFPISKIFIEFLGNFKIKKSILFPHVDVTCYMASCIHGVKA